MTERQSPSPSYNPLLSNSYNGDLNDRFNGNGHQNSLFGFGNSVIRNQPSSSSTPPPSWGITTPPPMTRDYLDELREKEFQIKMLKEKLEITEKLVEDKEKQIENYKVLVDSLKEFLEVARARGTATPPPMKSVGSPIISAPSRPPPGMPLPSKAPVAPNPPAPITQHTRIDGRKVYSMTDFHPRGSGNDPYSPGDLSSHYNPPPMSSNQFATDQDASLLWRHGTDSAFSLHPNPKSTSSVSGSSNYPPMTTSASSLSIPPGFNELVNNLSLHPSVSAPTFSSLSPPPAGRHLHPLTPPHPMGRETAPSTVPSNASVNPNMNANMNMNNVPNSPQAGHLHLSGSVSNPGINMRDSGNNNNNMNRDGRDNNNNTNMPIATPSNNNNNNTNNNNNMSANTNNNNASNSNNNNNNNNPNNPNNPWRPSDYESEKLRGTNLPPIPTSLPTENSTAISASSSSDRKLRPAKSFSSPRDVELGSSGSSERSLRKSHSSQSVSNISSNNNNNNSNNNNNNNNNNNLAAPTPNLPPINLTQLMENHMNDNDIDPAGRHSMSAMTLPGSMSPTSRGKNKHGSIANTRSISFPTFYTTDDHKFPELESMQGQIFHLSKYQQGCRFLQKKLEERNATNTQLIFDELYDHLVELMTDPFGNYLFTKLMEHGTAAQREQVLTKIQTKLLDVAFDMYGSQSLQKIMPYLTEEQVEMIVNGLKTNTMGLIKHPKSNYLIQYCLDHLPARHNQWIYDAVCTYLKEIACDRVGCVIVKRCVDHATPDQITMLAKEIGYQILPLVQDPFGNYVVQHVVEKHPGEEKTFSLIRGLKGHLTDLCVQKFSSNVVEKCLQAADAQTRSDMLNEIMNSDLLPNLLNDRFANFVIQTALDVAEPNQRQIFILKIIPHLGKHYSPYTKRLQKKILPVEEDASSKKKSHS